MATRLIKKSTFNIRRFEHGLKSIIESGKYKRIIENSEIFIHALELYSLGHRDIIDNILYADSRYFNLKLLTLDKELIDFIRDRKLKNTILTPDEI